MEKSKEFSIGVVTYTNEMIWEVNRHTTKDDPGMITTVHVSRFPFIYSVFVLTPGSWKTPQFV